MNFSVTKTTDPIFRSVRHVGGKNFVPCDYKPRGMTSKYLKKSKNKGLPPLSLRLYYRMFWFLHPEDVFCILLSRADNMFYVSHSSDAQGMCDLGPFYEPKTAASMCRLMNSSYPKVSFTDYLEKVHERKGTAQGSERPIGEGEGDDCP